MSGRRIAVAVLVALEEGDEYGAVSVTDADGHPDPAAVFSADELDAYGLCEACGAPAGACECLGPRTDLELVLAMLRTEPGRGWPTHELVRRLGIGSHRISHAAMQGVRAGDVSRSISGAEGAQRLHWQARS